MRCGSQWQGPVAGGLAWHPVAGAQRLIARGRCPAAGGLARPPMAGAHQLAACGAMPRGRRGPAVVGEVLPIPLCIAGDLGFTTAAAMVAARAYVGGGPCL